MEDEFKTDVATVVQDAFRGLLATLFYLVASATHDVAIYGREHVGAHHPTILLANHKRDFDSLVLAGVTYFARGVSRPNRRLIYALREDAFWRGFLTAYLKWPPFHVLAGLTVAPALQLLKAYPMGYVRSRADVPRIERQLRRFADLLDRGRDLYWTPEGGLERDGRLERFRAGFYRIVQASHAPLRMLPAAIFYDFMTTLRTRCFIRFGPEIEIDRSLSRAALERQARLAILRQTTVNVGHLAAAVLRHLDPAAIVDRTRLEKMLLSRAAVYRGAGLALDPRLTMRWTFGPRVAQFLRYAQREGILADTGGLWKVLRGLQHPEMQYVLNEVSEVELALGIDPGAGLSA